MKTTKYRGPLTTADTTRGPTNAIWYDCPVLEFIEDPSLGMYFFDDFLMTGNAVMSSAYTGQIGNWTTYGYAGAQIADGAKEGGVIKILADDDAEGMAMYSSTGAFRIVTTSTLALNRKLWFEVKLSRSAITNDLFEWFAGLMTPSLTSGLPVVVWPITATDDLVASVGSLLGFHGCSLTATRGGPTEAEVVFGLAAGTPNNPTNLTTLMASTGQTVLAADAFVKLGFVFDPDAPYATVTSATARQTVGTLRRKLIRFFVNGLELPTFLSTDDVVNATAQQAFPTGFMSPGFAIFNTAGSSPGSISVDWIRVAQRANS